MSVGRSGQPRRGGSFGGGVCEQDAGIYEAWRCDPRSSMPLGTTGMEQLFRFLNQPFYVTPTRCQIQGDFPVLTITPIELFRHMLARFEGERWSNDNDERAERPAFFEIFGGTALAVCHADRCDDIHQAAIRRPSDLDARFYISNHCFDSCRTKVEDYLHLKLIQTLSADKQALDNLIAPSMIRFVYFQKQAVVGDAFSLLSIGDSETGLNIDLEFAHLGNGVRKYFDEGNAGVIPLTLQQLSGQGPVYALSQTGDVEAMMELHFRKELVVHFPDQVVNGLTLYVHALCDKGQCPADADTEDMYGESFCEAFLSQCQQLVESGHAPLRFVYSFMRSHFALRPTLAAGAVAQILVELCTYVDFIWETELGMDLCNQLVFLLCDRIMCSFETNSTADATSALCWLLRFLENPTSDVETCENGPEEETGRPMGRVRVLQAREEDAFGRTVLCQVLAKRHVVKTSHVCEELSRQLRACAERSGSWHSPVLEAVCDMLDEGRCVSKAESESAMIMELLRLITDDKHHPEVASELLLGDLAWRMQPNHLEMVATRLLAVAPVEACRALSALSVSAAPADQHNKAARRAMHALQARIYTCPCSCCPSPPSLRSVKDKSACLDCAVLGKSIQKLLFSIIPAGRITAACAPVARAVADKEHMHRSPSPPAPPPGPDRLTAAAAPHSAQGPPQAGTRSPSPEEPQGNRSPSPDRDLGHSRPGSPPPSPPCATPRKADMVRRKSGQGTLGRRHGR